MVGDHRMSFIIVFITKKNIYGASIEMRIVNRVKVVDTPFSSLFFSFSFLFSPEQVLVSIVEAALNRCINITNVLPAVETAANAFYLLYSELCSTLLFYRGLHY